MADAAVELLLGRVSQLAAHLKVSWGANELRHPLMDDLDSFKDLLRLSANKQIDNTSGLRETARQIKEVVYDLEDIIIYASFTDKSTIITTYLHQIRMARKVKHLRETMRRNILHLTLGFLKASSSSSTSCEEEIRTKLRKDYDIRIGNFVGSDDDKNTIIRYLLNDENTVDVVSIVGMRGMGKTTLAWQIYKDANIEYHFSYRIWIHVSQKFEIRDICLNILESFNHQGMSSHSSRELIYEVQKNLERKRFFLVLDDICSIEDWKTIRSLLPSGKDFSGKVLITSCDNELGGDNGVGVYASGDSKTHKLRFMNGKESWELLQLEVFGNLNDCPQELEKIGNIIAHKCDGMPLQIVEVGEILGRKLGKSQSLHLMLREWHKVSESMNILLRNKKSISDAVESSYSGLPVELCECFLYMGVFPENYEISAWRLIRLWIAEGFIQNRQGQSLEEIAMQNLDALISKNLVMVGEINAVGEVKTCRVHNMIRRFCIDKACEQNLFQEIRSWEGVIEPPVSELHKSRRICVHSNASTLLSQVQKGICVHSNASTLLSQVQKGICVHSNATTLLPRVQNAPRVRSLLCFDKSPTGLDPSNLSSILEDFSLLKVVAIRFIFHQLPRAVTKLLHLKYITLSVDNLKVIPKSLSRLRNLQTFEVDTKSHFIVMKANIWGLIWLRHLKTDAAIFLSSKEGGAGCENLQTLSRLSPESCTEDVCSRARNLKALGIRGKLETLFTKNYYFLERLDRLEKLKLVNELFYEVASQNALHELPVLNGFPPNLRWLTLSKTFLKWKHMPTLARINTLEVLKLKDNAFTGIYWSTMTNFFPSLRFLLIAETDLVHWEASDKSFPSLKCLVLKKCENLNEIPLALAKNLDELDIQCLGESALHSAKNIEAEAKVTFKLTITPSTDKQSTSDKEISESSAEQVEQISAKDQVEIDWRNSFDFTTSASSTDKQSYLYHY